MKTETTKLLAVLTFLAFAFVALTAVFAADQYEADDAVAGDGEFVTVKLTKVTGVEYYLDGELGKELISGIVQIEVGSTLYVKTIYGYEATEGFSVLFDNVAQTPEAGGYKITSDTTVKVTGVEAIEWRETTISGGTMHELTCGDRDRITVSGIVMFDSGATITINGELHIPAGSILVVDEGAVLTINGQLLIEGDLTVNGDEGKNGKIVIAHKDDAAAYLVAQPELVIAGNANVNGEIEVKGALTVKDNMTIMDNGWLNITGDLAYAVVEEGAFLTMNGSMSTVGALGASLSVPLRVYGTVTFDTEDVTAYATGEESAGIIVKIGPSGIVDVVKFGVSGGSSETGEPSALFVMDNGLNGVALVIDTEGTVKTETGKIVGVVSGVKITDSAKTIAKVTTYTINISGTPAVYCYYKASGSEDEPEDMSATANVMLHGTAEVSDSLIFGESVSLTLENRNTEGVLIISGTVELTTDKSDAVKFTNNGEITIVDDGVLRVYQNIVSKGGVFDAVRYTEDAAATDKIDVYVTIDTALGIMNAAGNTVTSFTVLGEQTVTVSSTVPADIALEMNGSEATKDVTLNIGKEDQTDVVLKIEASDRAGLIKGNANTHVNVNGTLYAEKKTNMTEAFRDSILCDVTSKELNEKGKDVRDGWQLWNNIYSALTTAEAGDVIILENNVPVTATEMTDGTTRNLTIKEGVTVETNGKNITVGETKKLTVDGSLILEGASEVILNGEGTKKAVLEVNGMLMSDDSSFDLYGKYGLAGAYYGLEDMDVGIDYAVMSPVEVVAPIAAATVDAQIELKGDRLYVPSAEFVGILETEYSDAIIPMVHSFVGDLTVGTITLSNAIFHIENGKKFTGKIANQNGSFDMKVTGEGSEGAFADITDDEGTHVLTASGELTYYDEAKKVQTLKTDGTVALADFTAKAATLDGTVAIMGIVSFDEVSVIGDVAVDNEVTLKATKITITGKLAAAEATETDSEGTIEADQINLGTTLNAGLGSDAVLSGEVIFKDFILADPSATFPEYLKDTTQYKSTVFFVEGAEYLYTFVNIDVEPTKKVGDVTIDVTDADFNSWVDENGTDISDMVLGEVSQVYANITYEIYRVSIYTDAGVKSVSIDGIELFNETANKFALPAGHKLIAGTHTVSFTMKAGYTGTPTLKTITGTLLKDNKFVLSGTDVRDISLQLNGTDPAPEPDPVTPESRNEWTVTTILLAVLVVLIAIMAVIIAMRLNRS